MAMKEMLEQEHERDLLHLGHLEDGLRAMNDTASKESRGAQKAAEENVWSHMEEASLIRLDN